MSSPQKVLNCRYRYDPLDRLTSHTLSDTPERHRFYCKSRLATEIQGAVGHSIVQHDDLLLAQHQRQNGVLDSNLLATDLQRSVLHTLKSGRQPQPIAYSPYGHRPAESGLTSLLGFNGERPDPVTGHYLLGNGYRAFNPVLMRFNSPDSLSPFGKGGLNSYTYCLGDPINQGDPNGQSPSVFFRALFTRTIKINSRIFKIRPEISIWQAMRARKEIKAISKKLKTNTKLLNEKFKADRANAYAPPPEPRQMSLQRLAANAINSDSRIDSSKLANPLKRFIESEAKLQKSETKTIKHFYKEVSDPYGDLNLDRLDGVASSGGLSDPRRDNDRLMQLAKNYQQRIAATQRENTALREESISIWTKTFL
jgi:RHS repeat-associated protein